MNIKSKTIFKLAALSALFFGMAAPLPLNAMEKSPEEDGATGLSVSMQTLPLVGAGAAEGDAEVLDGLNRVREEFERAQAKIDDLIKDIKSADCELQEEYCGSLYGLNLYGSRLYCEASKRRDDLTQQLSESIRRRNEALILLATAREVKRAPGISLGANGYARIYERFLNGALIYNREKDENSTSIMKILSLKDPLNGTFKSPRDCRNLSISTGYPKEADHLFYGITIWIAPTFFIKANLETTGSRYREIFNMQSPDATVTFFWTSVNCKKLMVKYGFFAEEDMNSQDLMQRFLLGTRFEKPDFNNQQRLKFVW